MFLFVFVFNLSLSLSITQEWPWQSEGRAHTCLVFLVGTVHSSQSNLMTQ